MASTETNLCGLTVLVQYTPGDGSALLKTKYQIVELLAWLEREN